MKKSKFLYVSSYGSTGFEAIACMMAPCPESRISDSVDTMQ